MINLTYFKGESMKPTELKFKIFSDMLDWIIMLPSDKCVYIFGFTGAEGLGSIYITQYSQEITESFGDGFMDNDTDGSFYLQEYESYEDAYKVALDIREPNPLCYNK